MHIESDDGTLREQTLRELEAWIEGLIDLEIALGDDLERPCRLQRNYRRPFVHGDPGHADGAPQGGAITLKIGKGIFLAHDRKCAP